MASEAGHQGREDHALLLRQHLDRIGLGHLERLFNTCPTGREEYVHDIGMIFTLILMFTLILFT